MNHGIIPKRQQHWDIRAACNFIGGGTGTGLLLFAALALWGGGLPFTWTGLVGLACVGFGLSMVWLEIGRPWRAINVFFHPQTSWMTREGIVALPLFALAGLAVLLSLFGARWGILPTSPLVRGLALAGAVTGLAFLYCQARILLASKGITAWSEPSFLPLLLVTGLTEGIGLLLVLSALLGASSPGTAIAGLVLAGVRYLTWWRYVRSLTVEHGAPEGTVAALKAAENGVLWMGHLAPAILLLLGLSRPESLPAMAVMSGLALAGGGWYLKGVVVLKAARLQGFAIAHTPKRGRGTTRDVLRPGWHLPHQ